ncbi:hypothetical protein [Candidatus Nitrosocosmicus hydrocola]|uniref:hypothetical protein n=1 Tax=Candidatus Nitrosocosmicus hydrocola TaxID=1826872 RepID=UPI0011E60612|nr:hypothetical protein [Candidatus Nitrosocosmicus hydrocola]
MKTNSLKKNISNSKIVIAFALFATLMMSSMNFNGNSINVNALDMSEFDLPDVGQSLECVIVVVGCDGTGSVGSSGDTIIGSNNGNDDNNTNGNGNEGPLSCEECFREHLNETQISQLVSLLYTGMATIDDVCSDISSGDISAQELLDAFRDLQGITEGQIIDIFECLNLEIPPPPNPN